MPNNAANLSIQQQASSQKICFDTQHHHDHAHVEEDVMMKEITLLNQHYAPLPQNYLKNERCESTAFESSGLQEREAFGFMPHKIVNSYHLGD